MNTQLFREDDIHESKGNIWENSMENTSLPAVDTITVIVKIIIVKSNERHRAKMNLENYRLMNNMMELLSI